MALHKMPAFLGGDLNEKEQLAFQEGHDADIPSNAGVESDAEAAAARRKEYNVEPRKDKELSSPSSINEPEGDVEKAQPTTTAEEQELLDPNIVDFDGPDDPENPLNFTPTVKWVNITVLSALTLLTPLASSMFAPGVPEVLEEFGTKSQAMATFVVSVYLLGFAAGPIVIAPLSELYGRVIVYHVCNIGFILFTVACALATDMNMLIGFRFMAGAWGIAPITNGGGTIADLMPPEKRGSAMAIWAIGPLLGPVIGPVCGGFLAEAEGWRWIFWVIAIATGVVTIAGFFFMRETYAPTILEAKAKRLRKETGNPNLRSKLAIDLPPTELFIRAIVRPTKMLVMSPICALMSWYMAFVYAIMYLLFTTFTFVFEENYGFSGSTVGLVYIGCGVGNLLGLAILGKVSDPIMKYLANKHNGGVLKPEYRLPMLMYAGPFIPCGLFIYGWTAQYKVHWIVPILGTLFVGIGLIAAFMCINTYLVDTFSRYAASAMAANTILSVKLELCADFLPIEFVGMTSLDSVLFDVVAAEMIPIGPRFSCSMPLDPPQTEKVRDPATQQHHLRAMYSTRNPRTTDTVATMNVRADLFKILGSNGLPHEQYECLVRYITTLDSTAHELRGVEQRCFDRGAVIKQLNDHIHELRLTATEREEIISKQEHKLKHYRTENTEIKRESEKHRTDARDFQDRQNDRRRMTNVRTNVSDGRLFEQEKRIKDLQLKVATLEQAQEEQDTTLILATIFQQKAHGERQRLELQARKRDEQILGLLSEKAGLRERLNAKVEQVDALIQQIYQFTNASLWDDRAGLALRAQAEMNLYHLKGLQADVAERDTQLEGCQTTIAEHEGQIAELQAEVAERDAQVEMLNDAKLSFMRNMEQRQEKLIVNHKAVVEERKAAEEREIDVKIALANAEIKLAQWKATAEEQRKLIARLMASSAG
ncbi:hypothetical protein LTR56_015573 [Elasticomyces elasticus]|nr:hypothetical protein LTR56_015573 [Elasticomyces elasticus]KAK5737276.1 hypothetical protein LTS12_025946 [Elasticomyces elasticus]